MHFEFELYLFLLISSKLFLTFDLSDFFLFLRSSTCPLDFSQDEKVRTACKPEQIYKMTTIFTQNGPRLLLLSENRCHFVNLLRFGSTSFFLNLRKIT